MTTAESQLNIVKPKWGDQEDFEDYDINQEITTEAEPEPDGSIRKTVVEYKTNENGHSVQVVKKIRMFKTTTKINKRVEARKKWRKFGECANARGPEPGVTSVGDEAFLDLVQRADEGEAGKKPGKQDVVNLGIVCRNCGKTGDHWTLKCPYLKSGQAIGLGLGMEKEERRNSTMEAAISSGTDKYVPPGARKFGNIAGESIDKRRDDTATIRVTNLSEDTKEQDLSELFKSFGPISRIYLAKDKNTGLSKGFAFINFVYKEDAARAIEKLSGKFGYDHLILHLEWAKPSNK